MTLRQAQELSECPPPIVGTKAKRPALITRRVQESAIKQLTCAQQNKNLNPGTVKIEYFTEIEGMDGFTDKASVHVR